MYKGRKDVIICDSMPSIEFWFLLHYLNTNRYFATADDVIDVLRKYNATNGSPTSVTNLLIEFLYECSILNYAGFLHRSPISLVPDV